MKFLKFLAVLLLILGLAVLGLFITGNTFLLKGVWATYLHGNTSGTIDDAKYFSTNTVEAGAAQPWKIAAEAADRKLSQQLQDVLTESESVAFLVVKNGAIQYEQYWDGYSDSSRTNSFSMAKTITTLLVQVAIQEGYIKSWDDKVITYLPGLQGPYRDKLTLRHLTTMTAGLQWNEDYSNAFDITAKSYYATNIKKLMLNEVPVVVEPGAQYEYQSGATELLGMVLTEATGTSVSDFAGENLWKPLGAKYNAKWHADSKDGMEITYCCFNSNARDFARFGEILTDNGKWKGVQIIDSGFVAMATQPYKAAHYGYSFWVDESQLTPVFYFRGMLGQYIIVLPEKEIVIVRLGRKELEEVNGKHTRLQQVITEEVLKYF